MQEPVQGCGAPSEAPQGSGQMGMHACALSSATSALPAAPFSSSPRAAAAAVGGLLAGLLLQPLVLPGPASAFGWTGNSGKDKEAVKEKVEQLRAAGVTPDPEATQHVASMAADAAAAAPGQGQQKQAAQGEGGEEQEQQEGKGKEKGKEKEERKQRCKVRREGLFVFGRGGLHLG